MTDKVKYTSLTPITSDSQLRRAVNDIIANLAPLTGQHREKGNQALTWLDFEAAGYELRRGEDGGIVLPPPVTPEQPDMTTPPALVNFAAVASFNYVTFSWSQPAYRNHSHVEIWRAEGFKTSGSGPNVPTVLGDAVFRLMSPSIVASDVVLPSDVWRYWARNVSNTGVVGPWTSVDGLLVSVSDSPGYIIDKISGEIREGDLYPALGDKIDFTYNGVADHASLLSQHTTQITQNGNRIISISQIVDSQGKTLAEHTQTLSSHGTAIQQQASINTAQGALINAAWTVRIDSGNAVSGFGLMVDGATGRSDFIVRADRFAIAPPQQYDSNGKPIVVEGSFPFVVDMSVPSMPKTLIRNAYIDQAFITSLVTGQLVADKITGQIISGTHIRGGDIAIGSRFSVDGAGNAVMSNANVAGVVNATSLTATSSVSIGAVSGAGTYMTRDRIDVRDDAGVIRVRIGRL